MKKLLMGSLALIRFVITIALLQVSCKKECDPPNQICELRGTYTGTNTTSEGGTSAMTYDFRENNFAVGRVEPT